MAILISEIDELKKRLLYLEEYFNIDISDNLSILEDENIETLAEDINEIEIAFPDEIELISYSIADFWKYTNDLESIINPDKSTVKTNFICQKIITLDEFKFEKLNVSQYTFRTENYSLSIIEHPFLIGLIASKEGLCDDNYGITPCSLYYAVELEYLTEFRLIEEEENSIICRFLFHICSRIGLSIKIGELFEFPDEYYDYEEEDGEEEEMQTLLITECELPQYTLAMDYYVDALSIQNEEIKYLYFYKIIEFFAPVVSKKRSYELLNLKLDTLSVKNRDHKYLESIFQLTRDYDVSLKDKELTNTVLCECIDILEIFEYLPTSIKERLSKVVKFRKDEYLHLKGEKILDIKKELGLYLYSTRNSIVHAKSNYQSTGNECLYEDLAELNIFMSKLCHCLIVWNGRQAREYQV